MQIGTTQVPTGEINFVPLDRSEVGPFDNIQVGRGSLGVASELPSMPNKALGERNSVLTKLRNFSAPRFERVLEEVKSFVKSLDTPTLIATADLLLKPILWLLGGIVV